MNRQRLVRDALVVSGLVTLSYSAGWFAFSFGFSASRQIDFDFSKPYVEPSGYGTISMPSSPATSSLVTGERIDIFVERFGSIVPLVLDVVVTSQTKTKLGMLAPYGTRELLRHADDNNWRLIYRRSITFADPIAITQDAG